MIVKALAIWVFIWSVLFTSAAVVLVFITAALAAQGKLTVLHFGGSILLSCIVSFVCLHSAIAAYERTK